jgi:hypothetical protein
MLVYSSSSSSPSPSPSPSLLLLFFGAREGMRYTMRGVTDRLWLRSILLIRGAHAKDSGMAPVILLPLRFMSAKLVLTLVPICALNPLPFKCKICTFGSARRQVGRSEPINSSGLKPLNIFENAVLAQNYVAMRGGCSLQIWWCISHRKREVTAAAERDWVIILLSSQKV